MVCVRVVLYAEKCEKGLCKVTGEKTDVRESQGWRHWQESTSMKRFAGLSCSSLTVCCASVSAFCFPIVSILGLIDITTTHYTVHHHARTWALAWHGLIWRASVGTCNVSVSREWDGHGRSVSWLVDARVPMDHASVGLVQAHPKKANLISKGGGGARLWQGTPLNEFLTPYFSVIDFLSFLLYLTDLCLLVCSTQRDECWGTFCMRRHLLFNIGAVYSSWSLHSDFETSVDRTARPNQSQHGSLSVSHAESGLSWGWDWQYHELLHKWVWYFHKPEYPETRCLNALILIK